MAGAPLKRDPWQLLRKQTAARIALGRAGGSLPTAEVLDFAMAHAAARDAVWEEMDESRVAKELEEYGVEVLRLRSQAGDRITYLRRPDLGRKLDAESRARLTKCARRDADVVLVIADGLSALAIHRQARPLLNELIPRLLAAKLSLGPICLVSQGRVAIEDEIGELLGEKCAVILIGERPGLLSPDSLGAYLVYAPAVGRTDAERNCVSNIRPEGLAFDAAAETIAYLVGQCLQRKLSGVGLKDERAPRLPRLMESP